VNEIQVTVVAKVQTKWGLQHLPSYRHHSRQQYKSEWHSVCAGKSDVCAGKSDPY